MTTYQTILIIMIAITLVAIGRVSTRL